MEHVVGEDRLRIASIEPSQEQTSQPREQALEVGVRNDRAGQEATQKAVARERVESIVRRVFAFPRAC